MALRYSLRDCWLVDDCTLDEPFWLDDVPVFTDILLVPLGYMEAIITTCFGVSYSVPLLETLNFWTRFLPLEVTDVVPPFF